MRSSIIVAVSLPADEEEYALQLVEAIRGALAKDGRAETAFVSCQLAHGGADQEASS